MKLLTDGVPRIYTQGVVIPPFPVNNRTGLVWRVKNITPKESK